MAICVFDIFADGTAEVPRDPAARRPGVYRWWHFDLSDPELAPWAEQHLNDIAAGSLLQEHTRPRTLRIDEGLILNLRGINMNEGQNADRMISIRIYVQSDLIVTVRRNRVFALNEIRGEIERNAAPASPAKFLERLIGKLTARVQTHVKTIDQLVQDFETNLEDPRAAMPRALPDNRRSVIRLRRYLGPQRVALGQLAEMDMPLIPADSLLHLRELANSALIAVEELDELRDRLVSVQEEHDANVAQRQARHGYVLSLAAAIFLPLGFLTGLFGVNVAGMPGLENNMAFVLLCGAMAALALGLIALLRLLRWI